MPRGRVSAVRSRIMAAIRGKDTKPELVVRRAIHAAGLRYRLHRRDLPGSPDIVLTRLKTVVFVHGCFWHHHDCQPRKWPKTRAAFWRKKIENNVARDRRTQYFLRSAGWHVEVIWECELREGKRLKALLRTLRARSRRAKRVAKTWLLALGLSQFAAPAWLDAQRSSQPAGTPPPAIGAVLRCPPTLPRGAELRCELVPLDASEREILEWRFTPIGLSPIIRPRAERAASVWEGPVVASGTVRVSWRDRAGEYADTAAVAVQPRDWSDRRIPLRVTRRSPSRLPEMPQAVHELGSSDLAARVLPAQVAALAQRVEQGPNAGLWYLQGVPVEAVAEVDINSNALARGSDFWARHPVRRERRGRSATCSRRDVEEVVPQLIAAHEGLRGRQDRGSHVAVFAAALDAALLPRLEAVVDDDGNFDALVPVVRTYAEAAGRQSTAADEDARNPAVAPCTLNFP